MSKTTCASNKRLTSTIEISVTNYTCIMTASLWAYASSNASLPLSMFSSPFLVQGKMPLNKSFTLHWLYVALSVTKVKSCSWAMCCVIGAEIHDMTLSYTHFMSPATLCLAFVRFLISWARSVTLLNKIFIQPRRLMSSTSSYTRDGYTCMLMNNKETKMIMISSNINHYV